MEDETPDDKLLQTPTGEGEDSSRFNLRYQRTLAQLYAEQNGMAPARMLMPWSTPQEKQKLEEKHRRDQLELEQQLHDIATRQDQLLRQIEQEQAAIADERQQIDDNAIRLRDGTRVYVDGDQYRDQTGRVLTGADEAEAARQHEIHPDASTWAAKQEIERRAMEAQKLHDKVLAESGQGTPEQQAAHLDADERDFAAKVQARQDEMSATALPDYGSASMDDYRVTSAPAFNDASGIAQADAPKPKDDDSEGVTAGTKKPPQPFGQGGMKMG